MHSFLLRPFKRLILLLTSAILANACHQADQIPQPDTRSSVTLNRTFTYTPTNRPFTVAYPTDSLRYSVVLTKAGLILKIASGGVLTDSSGRDEVRVKLDSAAIKPGLQGDYDLAQRIGPTGQLPVDLSHYFTRLKKPDDIVVSLTGRSSFLPGSYFTITKYDPDGRRMTGRFSLMYRAGNPFAYDFAEDWLYTIVCEYKNLPLTQ